MAPQIHADNVAKGWWEKTDHKDLQRKLLLIISELMEGVEAERNNKPPADIRRMREDLAIVGFGTDSDGIAGWFTDVFDIRIKSTIEEELADTIIRILDLLHFWNVKFKRTPERLLEDANIIEYDPVDSAAELAMECIETLMECRWLLYCMDADHAIQTLDTICRYCETRDIPIVELVQWKLEYNKLRPFKHGNKLY